MYPPHTHTHTHSIHCSVSRPCFQVTPLGSVLSLLCTPWHTHTHTPSIVPYHGHVFNIPSNMYPYLCSPFNATATIQKYPLTCTLLPILSYQCNSDHASWSRKNRPKIPPTSSRDQNRWRDQWKKQTHRATSSVRDRRAEKDEINGGVTTITIDRKSDCVCECQEAGWRCRQECASLCWSCDALEQRWFSTDHRQ